MRSKKNRRFNFLVHNQYLHVFVYVFRDLYSSAARTIFNICMCVWVCLRLCDAMRAAPPLVRVRVLRSRALYLECVCVCVYICMNLKFASLNICACVISYWSWISFHHHHHLTFLFLFFLKLCRSFYILFFHHLSTLSLSFTCVYVFLCV